MADWMSYRSGLKGKLYFLHIFLVFADGIYFLNVSNRDYNKTIKVIKGNVLLHKADMIDSKQ